MIRIFILCIIVFLPFKVLFSQEGERIGTPYTSIKSVPLAAPIIHSSSYFFQDDMLVHLTLGIDQVQLHYTLDGSTPTIESPLYTDSILLDKSCILSVIAFHSDYLSSSEVRARFFKIDHAIQVKKISLDRIADEPYVGVGASGLIDLVKGSFDFHASTWLGFNGGDLEVLLELEEAIPLHKVIVSTLIDHRSWIFSPRYMEIYASNNGDDYKLIGKSTMYEVEETAERRFQYLEAPCHTESATFIKIILKNIPYIPDWHVGQGDPSWMFIDEIIFE